MQFGICTSVANAAAAKAAGWDYVEEHVQNFLQGPVADSAWKGEAIARDSALPIATACCLVPADLKITGPDADLAKLKQYMATIAQRAKKVGIQTLVFGSGGARNVPEGFDHAKAMEQIIAFASMAAEQCGKNGLLLVLEHLNRKECNIFNSVAECDELVHKVNSPHFKNLVDSYHLWLENESLEALEKAMPNIRHVHVSDLEGRLPPGETGKTDFRPFFRVLKKAGYNGRISVEALGFEDVAGKGPRVLKFLKEQWRQA
jgi:sugar phosphate isomerase/epimerase